jgi:hypothetical protein
LWYFLLQNLTPLEGEELWTVFPRESWGGREGKGRQDERKEEETNVDVVIAFKGTW